MQNFLSSLTHRERAGLVVFSGTLALLGMGSYFFRASSLPLEPTAPSPSASPSPSPAPVQKPSAAPALVVYVTGAVRTPGIYTLPAGARLYHAIHKAGGFQRQAQRDVLNLAGYLKDAEHVRVPRQGQDPPATPHITAARPTSALGGASSKLQAAGGEKVHLNTATAEELQRLPGIGPSMAQRILEYRQSTGSFQELTQLKEVRGIGEKTFAKLEPFLAL